MIPFEDIVWLLFNCSKMSRDIARLNLDEGAYLYKVAKNLPFGNVLEVGRYRGGSTILLASATENKIGFVDSVDIAPQNDRFVLHILDSLKLSNVHLIINDVNKMKFDKKYDMLFIDGDHSYGGVKQNFEHLKEALKQGGQLLFHDYAPPQEDVMKFVDEVVMRDIDFKKVKQVTSLIHFVKVQ